jgi:hypothetical protein
VKKHRQECLCDEETPAGKTFREGRDRIRPL